MIYETKSQGIAVNFSSGSYRIKTILI